MDPTNPVIPGASDGVFGALFVVILLVVVAGIVFTVVVNVRKYSVLKNAGVDPFTVDAQIAAKVLDSDVLKGTPAKGSVEERLAHLDDLQRRGVISAEERDAARADILRE